MPATLMMSARDTIAFLFLLCPLSIHSLTHFPSLHFSERGKAEVKDRKVLEILQAKDYKIQELEQVWAESIQSIFSVCLPAFLSVCL